jgi:hypothetical protein
VFYWQASSQTWALQRWVLHLQVAESPWACLCESLTYLICAQTTKNTPSASISAFGGLAKKKPLAHRAAANVSKPPAATLLEQCLEKHMLQ